MPVTEGGRGEAAASPVITLSYIEELKREGWLDIVSTSSTQIST